MRVRVKESGRISKEFRGMYWTSVFFVVHWVKLCFDPAMDIAVLQNMLHYVYRDPEYLRQALTHPSADNRKATNLAYERLEYLGDAVLELVVSRELFQAFPKADEGLLTQLRARVVSRAHLGELAKNLGLGAHLILSEHEDRTGGRDKNSILANTFETVIGAVMLDGGYDAARKVSLRLLRESIKTLSECPKDANPKGELQIILQALNSQGPEYMTRPVSPDVEFPFYSEVFWNGRVLASGEGPTKRKAEVEAAARAIELKSWEA